MASSDTSEPDARFPSGEWTGFFIQPRVSQSRQRMDIPLSFSNGKCSGEGRDPIGDFALTGTYDTSSGDVHLLKQYRGAHSVRYHGYAEAVGIWGTWEIAYRFRDFSVSDKGGFHIWPRGMTTSTSNELAAEINEPAGRDHPILVP